MRWKVSKQEIKLFPHPNADKLEVGRVGDYQVVVQKGLYKDGDVVVFAPEKSVLTGRLREEFANYLAGTNADRVKSVRLRGELSCGIIVPPHLIAEGLLEGRAVGEDVSDLLGITKYVPQIPKEMQGEAEPAKVSVYRKHDLLHFSVYESEFSLDERILITEKIHGVQCSCVLDADGNRAVMSKGLADEGIAFKEGQDNVYWRAVKNASVFENLAKLFEAHGGAVSVQVFGEVVPTAKGFGYGFQGDATFLAFRLEVITESAAKRIQYDDDLNPFRNNWVPVLYDGVPRNTEHNAEPGTIRKIASLCCTGPETVSGKKLHKREGCVVEPYAPRYSADGEHLRVKFINPDYKETGEELS